MATAGTSIEYAIGGIQRNLGQAIKTAEQLSHDGNGISREAVAASSESESSSADGDETVGSNIDVMA